MTKEEAIQYLENKSLWHRGFTSERDKGISIGINEAISVLKDTTDF